ncbi:MAG TPA: hypothetical protein VER17_17255 [Tepidisphaeraceae bacterium]|nr:hypothetical protein [Tepidisphaeraceae bacterium]
MAVSLPLCKGGFARGQLVSFDGAALAVLRPGAGVPQAFDWTDVQPRAQLALSEKLLGPTATGAQWAQVGENLLKTPGGAALAERAFGKALRLDASLRGRIDTAKASATSASASAAGTGATSDAPGVGPATRSSAPAGAGAAPATTGPAAWPVLGPDEMKAAVDDMKRRADRYQTLTSAKLTPYETQYFLFCSNLPQSEAARWAGLLDRMYARLAELFAIPPGVNIWRGKALIIVFLSRDDFLKFELAAFKNTRDTASGFCHGLGDGSVIIDFYRSPTDLDFARLLVHETTHGFIHRYRSKVHVPSWVNEGLAEVMAFQLVPHEGLRQSDDARARSELKRAQPLLRFFELNRNIDGYQYPIARALAEFMIRKDKAGYVKFINAIKDDVPAEQAVTAAFGVSLEQLLAEYGASMGVPGLRP